MQRPLLGLMTLGLVLAGGRFAQAQSPSFSDSLTVYDPRGAVLASTGVTEADEDKNAIYYVAVPGFNLVDPTQFGNPTNLVEPDGTFSDIFGLATGGPNGLDLAFSSDIDDGLGTPFAPTGTIILPEGNGVFSATMYLDPALQAQGYTAVFISDAVPEPGSIALMVGFGVAGAGFLGARRRK